MPKWYEYDEAGSERGLGCFGVTRKAGKKGELTRSCSTDLPIHEITCVRVTTRSIRRARLSPAIFNRL